MSLGYPAELWTPVRFVRSIQTCSFCFEEIPTGSPGNSTGTRGTRAYYCARRSAWLCLACKSEYTRSDIAREEEDERIACATREAFTGPSPSLHAGDGDPVVSPVIGAQNRLTDSVDTFGATHVPPAA
jgi:hypothetical protein